MSDKIARDLAISTEELTAPAVAELTEAEISAVCGGLAMGAELAEAA